MLCITTTPGSALESNGSTIRMIGGAGSLPEKIARTNSTPGIEAMISVGVTPYSTGGAGWASMGWLPAYDDGHHTKQRNNAPAFSASLRAKRSNPVTV